MRDPLALIERRAERRCNRKREAVAAYVDRHAQLLREARLRKLGVMAVAIALSVASTHASAHSFYSWECCHDRDCAPLDEALVRAVPGGFFLVESGETIPQSATRPSPDGLYHRCVKDPADRKSQTLCLYAPPPGV